MDNRLLEQLRLHLTHDPQATLSSLVILEKYGDQFQGLTRGIAVEALNVIAAEKGAAAWPSTSKVSAIILTLCGCCDSENEVK